MSKLKTLAAAALGGMLCASVIAQEASYSPADANKDGYVTEAERAQHDAMLGDAITVVPPIIVIEPQERAPRTDTYGEPDESSRIGGD